MANVMDSATEEGRVATFSLESALIGYAGSATSANARTMNGKVWAVRYHTTKLGESLVKGDEWSIAYHAGALRGYTEGW